MSMFKAGTLCGFALVGAAFGADLPVAQPAVPPGPRLVLSIESYELVCKNDRPTIVATVVTNSEGWTDVTAVFAGGPPKDGHLPYHAQGMAPTDQAAMVLTKHAIEVPVVITKGTNHIDLVTETQTLSQPHPKGC